MVACFSSWDIDVWNLVDTREDGPVALRLPHSLIEGNVVDYTDMLDLSGTSAEDQTRHIATRSTLIVLARGVDARRSRSRRLTMVNRRRHVIRDVERISIAS